MVNAYTGDVALAATEAIISNASRCACIPPRRSRLTWYVVTAILRHSPDRPRNQSVGARAFYKRHVPAGTEDQRRGRPERRRLGIGHASVVTKPLRVGRTRFFIDPELKHVARRQRIKIDERLKAADRRVG